MITRFGETFAQTSLKGALTRAAIAWILITPVVAAAKIWSRPAAVVVCLVAVAIYIAVAMRFIHRDCQPRAT